MQARMYLETLKPPLSGGSRNIIRKGTAKINSVPSSVDKGSALIVKILKDRKKCRILGIR